MATRIDGKALAAKVKGRVAAAVKTLPRRPGLAVVLVGDDPASQVYVRGKEADCAECGIRPLQETILRQPEGFREPKGRGAGDRRHCPG